MLVSLSIFHHREFISPALLSSLFLFSINYVFKLYPGNSEVKASACNVGNPGLFPGSGRSPGEGNDNLPRPTEDGGVPSAARGPGPGPGTHRRPPT